MSVNVSLLREASPADLARERFFARVNHHMGLPVSFSSVGGKGEGRKKTNKQKRKEAERNLRLIIAP